MKKLGYIVGLILGLLLVLAVVGIAAMALWRLVQGMNGQVAAGLATFVGTAGLAIWTFNRTKDKERDARLFPQRADIYQEVLDILKELSWDEDVVGKKKPTEHEVAKRLLDAKFKMMVWGSNKTLRALDHVSEPNQHEGDTFSKVAYLMGAIRQDLGHKVSRDDCVSMVLYMIKAEDKARMKILLEESVFFKTRLRADFKS